MKATEILNNVKELLSISKEVPTELSKQEEVELSEEVVHSPESVIETKKNLLSNPNKSMTTEQRVNRMLFN